MNKTAIVFGATGLIGNQLINLLRNDDRYDSIKVFSRRGLSITDNKLEVKITNLFDYKNYQHEVKGDDLFFCIGTTSAKTKDKEEYRQIEFNLPVELGKIARRNDIPNFIIVSSIGANAKSKSFYLKNKGEMEDNLLQFGFKKLHILRPSLLLGKRNEFRIWELIGKLFYLIFGLFMIGKLRNYKGIKAITVAKCMLYLANDTYPNKILETAVIKLIARKI